MGNTPNTEKKTTWECVLSSEEKDYIIKAALFHDYSGIRIDRESPLLNALLKGDIGNAMKQSLFILANYKTVVQVHDVALIDEEPVYDSAGFTTGDREEFNPYDEPEFRRTPPPHDEFTHWDGDGTERFDYGT
jgi:hypothetical protein